MSEITVRDETFEVRESVAPLALMRYSEAAVRGVDSGDMEGQAVMYVLLRACFLDDEWYRFEKLAISECLSHADLHQVVMDVVAAISERPTERPSESSDGPQAISPRSEADSSSRVIGRLEGKGRPDLALQVVRSQEFMAEQAQAV